MDHAPLGDHEAENDPALGAALGLYAQVVKAAGIPEGHEIPMDGIWIVDIADSSIDESPEGILGDPALASKLNLFNDVLSNGGCGGLRSRGRFLWRSRHVFKGILRLPRRSLLRLRGRSLLLLFGLILILLLSAACGCTHQVNA